MPTTLVFTYLLREIRAEVSKKVADLNRLQDALGESLTTRFA